MRRFRWFPFLLLAAACAAQDPFAAAAGRAVRARAGQDTLRVLLLGDSHTQARAFAAAWRACLQAQFGEGGFAGGQPWLASAGPRCGRTPGWKAFQPTLRNGTDGRSGPGGAYLEARGSGERAWVEAPFRRFRLHLLRQPGGGRVRLRVDRRAVAELDLDGPPEVELVQPDLAAEGRRLEIECLGGPVRILGLALENGPGASFAAQGTIGAQASWLLRSDPALFRRVLLGERPDLVVLAFGTNEASLADFDEDAYRRNLAELLERFRAAAPGAALALLGPPDSVLPRARPGALAAVARIQEELAQRQGALFVDLRAAMGGEGSMPAWMRDGLALKDRIHFSPDGYARLARTAVAALFARMARSAPAFEDPRLAKARTGAFELPAEAPRLLGRFERSTEPEAAVPRPIYTFRTEEGRLFITDDPAKVEGMRGTWVGRGPQ